MSGGGSIPKAYFKYGLLAGLGIGALVEYENLDILFNTFGRDVKTIAIYARILAEYRKLQRLNKTVPDYFYETAKKFLLEVKTITKSPGNGIAESVKSCNLHQKGSFKV